MTKLNIGIIGTGRFGQVLRSLFNQDKNFELKMASTSQPIDYKTVYPLAEVLAADIVIPALPISALKDWLRSNQLLITKSAQKTPDQLWLSVCSVMEKPQEWCRQYLPDSVTFIPTHPIFGPTSSHNGSRFAGLPWAIPPDPNYKSHRAANQLISYARKRGIIFHTMTASKHDQLMARSQAVAFLFGEIGRTLKFSEGNLDTIGYQHLLSNQRIYEKDSRQLLVDMFAYNRHAQKMLKEIIHIVTKFEDELK